MEKLIFSDCVDSGAFCLDCIPTIIDPDKRILIHMFGQFFLFFFPKNLSFKIVMSGAVGGGGGGGGGTH